MTAYCSDYYSVFNPSLYGCLFAQGAKKAGELSNFSEMFDQLDENIRNKALFTVKLVGFASTAILIGQIALKVFGSYLQAYAAHWIGRPQLAMEFEMHTWKTTVVKVLTTPLSFLWGADKSPVKPIFKPEIQEQIDQIQNATLNIRNHQGFFSNLLLYGPPGTGKTMVSKMIAKGANMNYILLSGGDLAQFIKRGEHVSELNTLFNVAKNASRPTIIFIDEVEGLAKSRDKLDMERVELLNAFLNHTGEASKKIMLILTTNRPQDLDEAVLSRIDHQIYIGPPPFNERLKILKLYINQFFKKKEIFTEELLLQINRKIDGFTGREIFKLCNGFATALAAQNKEDLDLKMIYKTLDQMVANRNEIKKRIQVA